VFPVTKWNLSGTVLERNKTTVRYQFFPQLARVGTERTESGPFFGLVYQRVHGLPQRSAFISSISVISGEVSCGRQTKTLAITEQ
jgi:hypothetical protein